MTVWVARQHRRTVEGAESFLNKTFQNFAEYVAALMVSAVGR
jgi:hypothetical protein